MFGKLQEVNEKNRTFVLLLRIRGLGKELQGNINIDQSYYGTYPAKRMKRSARQMKDRDLMVYLMKENIKLREKLRETEETSDYWFQEYRELKKRNEK